MHDKNPSFNIELNYERIIARVLSYWYIFILSIGIAFFIAFISNRYATKIYPVSASILVKENQEMSEAEFIIKNSLVSSYKNYFNELYIIKSYPLIESVIRDLDFQVAYFAKGNVKTTEYYADDMPIEINILQSEQVPYGKSMLLSFVDKNHFSLEYLGDDDDETGERFTKLPYNDSVQVNGFAFYVDLVNPKTINEYLGRELIVRFYDPENLTRLYSTRLGAKWAGEGASVVELNLTGSTPEKEKAFLKRFIERYQLYDVDKKNQVAIKSLDFLEEQLEVIGDSLRFYEDQIESFKQKNIITSLDAEAQRLYQKLEVLETQKVQRILTENYYIYVINKLSKELYDGIITPQSVGIDDVIIATLITELIRIQAEIRMYLDVEKVEENPILRDKKRRISQIKEQIIKAIQTSREARELDESYLKQQISALEKQLNKLPGAERALVNIQRNYKLRENLYIFLLEKKAEVGITKASATSSIIGVNPPIIGGIISPNVKLNYLLALSFGMIIPIVIFFLMEIMNKKIQAKEDIEQYTNAPLIGGVGHNPTLNNLIVYEKPRGAVAEAFRALRSNLNYFTQNADKKVFLVTSSIAGEGKTFTSTNLATVLAMSGKKTLLIGADLRRPKLFDDFEIENNQGLSQYLSGMIGLENLVINTKIENLSLILGGPVPPNPSELLMRHEMDELIEYLLTKFDYLILDTPPVGLVTDAFVLNRFADHILYVVRQNYTPKDALMSLEESIQLGQLDKISIVFNDIRKNGPGYGYGYRYGYGYGYGYGYSSNKRKLGGYYEED